MRASLTPPDRLPLLFALGLLASGFAASGACTFSGQVVMQGFLSRRIEAALVNRPATTFVAVLVALVICALCLTLIALTVT